MCIRDSWPAGQVALCPQHVTNLFLRPRRGRADGSPLSLVHRYVTPASRPPAMEWVAAPARVRLLLLRMRPWPRRFRAATRAVLVDPRLRISWVEPRCALIV